MSKFDTTDNSIKELILLNFTEGVHRLIDISLDAKKALKFKLNFDYPRTGHIKPNQKIRNHLEMKLEKEGLDAYVNEIIRTKTYVYHESRTVLEKLVRENGMRSEKARKKVG